MIETAAVSKVDVEAKDGASVTESEWNFCSLKVGTYLFYSFFVLKFLKYFFFEGGHLPA